MSSKSDAISTDSLTIEHGQMLPSPRKGGPLAQSVPFWKCRLGIKKRRGGILGAGVFSEKVDLFSRKTGVDDALGFEADVSVRLIRTAGDRQELSQNRDLRRIQSPLNRWVGTGRPGLRQFNAVVATTSEFRVAKCSSTFLNVASRVSGGMAILAFTTSSAKRVRCSEASDS